MPRAPLAHRSEICSAFSGEHTAQVSQETTVVDLRNESPRLAQQPAYFDHFYEPVGEPYFQRLMKNVQMQGIRNPEKQGVH